MIKNCPQLYVSVLSVKLQLQEWKCSRCQWNPVTNICPYDVEGDVSDEACESDFSDENDYEF